MPPPSDQRAEIEPPEQITEEAVRGFLAGALRVGVIAAYAMQVCVGQSCRAHPAPIDISTQ